MIWQWLINLFIPSVFLDLELVEVIPILIYLIIIFPLSIPVISVIEIYKFIFNKQIKRKERLNFLKRKRYQRDEDLKFGHSVKWYKAYFWKKCNITENSGHYKITRISRSSNL